MNSPAIVWRRTTRIINTKYRMRITYLFITCIFSFQVSAEQTVINDYNDARDNYFYNQLYIGTIGESLYCGIQRPIHDIIGKQRSLEHVLPADSIAELPFI